MQRYILITHLDADMVSTIILYKAYPWTFAKWLLVSPAFLSIGVDHILLGLDFSLRDAMNFQVSCLLFDLVLPIHSVLI